jgi:diguanylate cyclase (GGDEF)-like protein/PAS domain S-box-containing protein
MELDAHKKPQTFRGTIQDITDRKIAEAAIQESSGLLQIFIQDAPTGLAMFDREMRYIAASRRWIEDYGLDEWEVIGHCHYDLIPEIPEHWREQYRRALAGETVVSIEDSYVAKGGVVRWKRRMMRPWLTGSGEIGGIVILAEDVTHKKLAEMALHESKELLQLFIEHAPAALAMFDREMNYIAASRRWIEDFGLLERDIIGKSHYEIFPEIPERWKEVHRSAQAGETFQASEDSFTRADGSVQWLRWEVRPWRTGDDAIGGIMIFSEDITRSKQSEERLHLAASVFTHASEGITITDVNGNILDVNDAFTRITGYSREEVVGKNPRILNSGRQTREFYSEMWNKLLLKGHWAGEIWNRAKDGRVYAEMLTISAVRDAAGQTQQYVAMFSDITSIKEQKKQLEHVAQHDLLTGLPNRVLLADRIRQALAHAHRRSQPVAIACLDLDNFKAVNDRHGHMVGDQLLTAVAHRMRKELHEDDTLARLGGDEFVVVMPELAREKDSIAMVDALLRAVEEPVLVGDLAFQVSASIGVTFFPQQDDVDADQLLRQADQAMYQAKLEGKSRYHIFDPRGDRDERGHHEDIERIRNALKAREFVLYFQPKVNMSTGEIFGAEGLIRWQHPAMGLLPPAQFLPIVEGHALAIELGEWVIDSALSNLESWMAEGLDISVSVNVAAQQLQQEGFADRLGELLAAHPQVSPSKLELEVLESSALEDVAVVSKVISDCRSLGVTFSLDDFGTGYSSLSYLKRLPVDVLKIDQTFVHDMLDDPEDLTILEGVLSLATAFRRNAIAEGVETLEHGVMLLRLGCQAAQGYGIARPMPARELAKWAANWRPDPRWVNAVPLDATDRPLLSAGVELRAWTVMIEEFVAGRRHLAPGTDRRECRLGGWLFAEALAGRSDRAGLKEIDALHQQVHNLAEEIIALKTDGRGAAAMVGLEELRALRDELLEKLQSLMQSR